MEDAKANSSKTILVVDDDESILSFLVFCLKSEGFQISSAKSAEDALNILKNKVPDLVLLDIMLPQMDGFAMCKLLRQEPRTMKVPVLFITAYADPHNLQKAQDVGAQGLIEKPILFDELLMQIYDAFHGRFALPTRLKFSSPD